jgi:hypothetical protein
MLFLIGAVLVGPASAQTADLRAAVEQVQHHRRAAEAYLRTGNVDIAMVELEKLQAALSELPIEGGASPPGRVDARTFAAARAEVDRSLSAAERGELDKAERLLEGAGRSLDTWRREAGLVLFSDCIGGIAAAYEGLDRHRMTRPDLADAAVRAEIRDAGTRTRLALARCDAEAPAPLRNEGEFRRLVDGFEASLDLMEEALARQDPDYLHRLLIEQRSLERLLAFRYG